jgi:diguanylate cyclase (GGDEF)-like protein/PAS domain S-box-containing protein
MRARSTLIVFAGLLILSTSIAFVGYRYLSLASEYRERNFIHLETTQKLLESLQNRSSLLPGAVAPIREQLNHAIAQAQWCLDTLFVLEKRAFEAMGAGRALELCRNNIEMGNYGLTILDEVARDSELNLAPNASPVSALMMLTGAVRQMNQESQDFQPYVTIIEAKIQNIITLATSGLAICIAIIFGLIAKQSIASAMAQKTQTAELTRLATIAQLANDAILVTDASVNVTWANPAFERLSGYTLDEMLGRHPGRVLQGPRTDAKTIRDIRAALRSQSPIKCEILNYKRNGDTYWISLSISPLTDTMGQLEGYVAISNDITSQRQQKREVEKAFKQVSSLFDEVEYQANHDSLTSLPNRRFIDKFIQSELRSDKPPRTLIRIDLDHFKVVNDTLGHAAGDTVLQTISRILRSNIRHGDVIGRIGGDEFIVILANGISSCDAMELAGRLCSEIGKDILFDDQVCRIGASFGVASAMGGLVGNEDLLQAADAALYLAKSEGRNQTQLYTPEVHRCVSERRKLAKDLERALAAQEFEAYFQPQVDARTETVVGIEALARWRHPSRGILAPNAFMSTARALGLIGDIDSQIFRHGLAVAERLSADGIELPKLSFNAELVHLNPEALHAQVVQHDIGDTRLTIEVLETSLIEEQGASMKGRVDKLRSLGFSIELDDFGSGHASVVALQWLSPDYLKIDRQLITPVAKDASSMQLVQSIVQMGKALQIKTIAEGVETAAQASILREMGCDVFQGYLYGRPMPEDDLKAFLNWDQRESSNAHLLNYSI